MDYLISFEDGSTGYLSHHGVKGMRWGIWNAETRRRRTDATRDAPRPSDRLREYSSEKVTSKTLQKYSDQARQLNRVRTSDNASGIIYSKNGKLVGMINTEKKPSGEIWIQGLEVFGDNKGKGIGRALLDKAVNDMGATHLSVRKTNTNAKRLYDSYGFKTYDDDGFMYYMNYDKKIAHSFDHDSHGYLSHHGVKGMKWGVRRTPEQLGHWRMSERSVKDRTLSPKTNLYRISNNDDEFSGKSNRKFTYVSTNEKDRDEYKSNYEYFKDINKKTPMVEYTLNSVKPLTIAGGKTVVESLMKASNDPNLETFSLKNFGSEKSMRKYLNKIAPLDDGDDTGFIKDKYTYTDFASKQDYELKSKALDDLKKKGYDGLVDLFDRGWEANDPTIIFDPQKKLKVKEIKTFPDWYD